MHIKLNDALKLTIRTVKFFKFLMQMIHEFAQIARKVGPEQTQRCISWIQREFESPAPNFVKWDVLTRWGSKKTWIETGTYLGETTEFLSKYATQVISIEPSPELVDLAMNKFASSQNISIVQGTSENVLSATLDNLDGDSKADLNFWLDGHYSAGITYLGNVECPVPEELSIISQFLNSESKVTILIDDVRSFSPTGETRNGYPSLSFLANWADENRLFWTIEHDIFIMTNRIK